MDNEMKFPFYAKASLIIVGSFAFIAMLYIGKAIIVPVIFSVIIAISLHPVVSFLEKRKINRVVSIVIALLLTFIFIAGLGLLLFSQGSRLSDSWPILVEKFTEMLNQSIVWFSGYFDINPTKITEWLTKTKGDLINISTSSIGQTLMGVGNVLMNMLMIPIYVFLILFYQPLLLEFFRRAFGKSNRNEVSEIIKQIKKVIQRYLFGLVIEFIIMAILNSVALLILGIDYAILLGIIGALLNVIPYIGGVVGTALPMMIAIVSKDSPISALYVLLAYILIQVIDNNFIVPKIVASKVKINALISIIVVFAFGALWGLSGMFIAIPLTAIMKIIFDHIEPLKPWGFLLGDTMPVFTKLKSLIAKKVRK